MKKSIEKKLEMIGIERVQSVLSQNQEGSEVSEAL
jgi:hypothetical protein